MEDLDKLFAARERAKEDWVSFENNDPRFPYPRKNYKYVTRIVEKEGTTSESIDRATAYFDTFQSWIPRAEAYQYLAERVTDEDKRRLATSVYSFVSDELPNLHFITEKIEQRLDHALGFLNWAAVASADSELIDQQRTFIYGKLPQILHVEPSDVESNKLFYEYYRDDFEAQLDKTAHCAALKAQNGNITPRERALGYMTCQSCQSGLTYTQDGWKQFMSRTSCVTGAAQVIN